MSKKKAKENMNQKQTKLGRTAEEHSLLGSIEIRTFFSPIEALEGRLRAPNIWERGNSCT